MPSSNIRTLFGRELTRPIEKVITYQNRAHRQLKAEVTEYIVTDHIDESFEHLLKLMQTALQGGDGHEIGVWVSGFYGSGKSSFTKYLGFALSRDAKVDGNPFLQLLKDQLRRDTTRGLFNSVSAVCDPEVIFLDLASEMLAGASMEDISTVLYLKVLQWAGFSEDLKVAELERMLERDGKLAEFEERATAELDGYKWRDAHNQPLVANQIAGRLAAEFYPKLFRSPEEFQNLALSVFKSELQRTQEMIDLIRRRSGKKNIIFVVDEVGQYVSAKPSLITNLDGFAKNLKQLGEGHVWLFATAQQTLTEDNPSAILNAPGLFKLKDRFPIQVHLEAHDIKEICHRRLLTKSSDGEKTLGRLFDTYGPQLRTATQLRDAGVYEAPLDRTAFINLYPFLPAHFEILLQLLGRLARKTGGLGLRSAIKVLQDVLIEHRTPGAGTSALADGEVGTLANTVTFYDSLRRDILSTYGYIVDGVKRVEDRFPSSQIHRDVAKSIAVLQILENLPVSAGNIAALLHAHVDSASRADEVKKAIDELLKDTLIPLGEKNGSLRFLTQTAVTLQKQLEQIEYRNADVRADLNNALRQLFKPLPSTRLNGVRPVSAGVRVALGGGQFTSLEGEREPIQLHVEFVSASSYPQSRQDRENDSRSSRERTSIFLLARENPEAQQLAITIVRCGKFLQTHRTAVDPETQEFVRIVAERQERAAAELDRVLRTSLAGGSFIAHGAHRAVTELDADFAQACTKFLARAAAHVFDRYAEAAVQADSNAAERFLKTPLDHATTSEDPLGVVTRSAGKAQVKRDFKALVSIRDYLGNTGQVEGRRLLDTFSEPPFGWSKDTTRYLVAALFMSGEIKLRIAGQDHQVRNDDTLAAFASNKAFGSVGIALREERPDPEALIRASDRLRELTGENIGLLEDDIAAAAKRHFPTFQQSYSALAAELRGLALPGADRADDLSSDLAEVIRGDGSDAVRRLGGVDSPLADTLKWARKVKHAFGHGLQSTLVALQPLRAEIPRLPDSGIPGKLKADAADRLDQVAEVLARDAFYDETAALNGALGDLNTLVATTVSDLIADQKTVRENALAQWQKSSDWFDLLDDDRGWFNSQIDRLGRSAEANLAGLRQLLAYDFDQSAQLRELAQEIGRRASRRREELARKVAEETKSTEGAAVPKVTHTAMVYLPPVIETTAQLEALIKRLQELIGKLTASSQVKIQWTDKP